MGTGHPSSDAGRLRPGALLLLVVALLLGACGGDFGDGGSDTPTARPQNSRTTVTPAPAETTAPETTSDGTTATIPPPLDLAGTSWVPTDYTQSTGGFTNTLGDDVLLVFGEDGTLSGHTGCNEFEGTWETTGPYYDYDEGAEAFEDKIDGQPITITAEPTTAVECEGFLADQDADLLAALVATEIWYIGSTLGDQAAGITLHSEDERVYADPA